LTSERSETTAAGSGSATRSVRDGPESHASLLARAERGDEAAWNEIVERFANLLWSICRSFRLADDEAIDVSQTTWLRLIENLGKIQDPDRLAGWLATTARRECLQVLRRTGREDVGWSDTTVPTVLDGAAVVEPHAGTEVEVRLLTDERDAELWRCFSSLPERCQRLLRVLMATESKAYAEVSAAIGLPIGSIGPTRMRCLRRLRELATGAGYDFFAAGDGSV
jgi:RNA polymerase sigma factor (sigma-70 family)